jgi:hypothetical protein
MPLTDAQRRWWFATHPEYSRHSDRFTLRRREREVHRMESQKMAAQKDPEPGLQDVTYDLLLPVGRFLKAPVAVFKGLLRSQATGYVLNAAKRKVSEGPGKWVEVCRSRTGLEHQSKMSGQVIRKSEGKHYINEYDVNGVKFDDYKKGTLYEYKGSHGSLIGKDRVFRHWFKGTKQFQAQAWRQLKAANGKPVVWRVGADQVKAFEKALKGVDGIIIKP